MSSRSCSSHPAPAAQTTTGSREYEAALVADVIATWNLDPRWRYTIELSKSRVPDGQVLFKGCKRYQRKGGSALAAAPSSSLERKDSRPVLADLLWADKIAAETKEKASCKTVEVYTVTFSDSERQHEAPVPAKGKVLRVYFYVPSSTCASSGTGSASASDGSSAPVVTFSFEEDKIVLPSNRPSSAKHIKTRINLALKETAKLLENVGGGRSSSSARFPGQERKAWNLRQVAETKFEKDRTQNLATLLQDGSIYFDGGKPLRQKWDAPGGRKPFAAVDVRRSDVACDEEEDDETQTVHPREQQEQGFSDDKPAQDHDDHPGRGINVEYLLQNTFDAADEEKTGFLLFTEVHHLLIALFGKRLRSFEVTKLVAKTEEDAQGQVDYAKFLAKLSPEIQRQIEANAREGSRMQRFLKGGGGDEQIENARELIADFLPLLSSEQLLSQNEGELVETAKLLHQTRERGQQFITRALARDWLARSRRFTAIELSLIMTRLPMQAAYNEDVVRHLLDLRGAFQKTFAEKFLLDASHKNALAENMKPWLRKVCVAVLEVVGVVGREVPLRSFAKIVGGGGGAGVNGGKNSAGIKVGETVTDEDEAELPERDHDEGTALDQRMTDLLAAGKKRILLPIWVLREALLRQEEYLFSRGEIHALLCWVDVAEGGFVELVSFLVSAHVTAFELFLLPQLKAMDERNRLQKQGESGYGPATTPAAATTAASAPDAFGFAAVGNVGSGSKMEGAFSFLRQQHQQNDHGPDAGADQQQTNSNSPSNARISKTVSINSPRNRQTTSANQEQDFRKRELLERDILQLNFSRKWIDIPTLLQIARPLEKVLRASMDSDEIVVASVANFATGAIAEDGDADAPRPGDSFHASSSSSRTKETVLSEREARGFVAQAPFYTSAAQHHGGTSLGSGGGSAAPAQHSVQAGGAPGVVAATGGATKLPPQQQHLPADHSHRAEIQQQQLITTGSSTSAVLVKEILWADYVKDEISRLWEFRNNVQLQNFVAGADLQTLLSRYDAVFAGVRENLMEDSCKNNLQRRLGGSGEGGGGRGAADKVGEEGCHRDGAADHGLLQPATSAGPGALGSSLVGAMSFSAGMLTSPLASGGGALSGAKSFAGAGLAAVGAQKLPPGALKQQLLQKKVGAGGNGSSPRGAAEKTDRWQDPLRPFRELLFKTDSVKASKEQEQQDDLDQRPPVDDPDSARFHTLLADFVRRWNEAEREDGGLVSAQQGGALTAAGVNENAYARNEREVGARRGSMDTSFARRGSMDLQKRRSIGGARGSILGTAQTPQLHQQL